MTKPADRQRVLVASPDAPSDTRLADLTWRPGSAAEVSVDILRKHTPHWLMGTRVPRILVADPFQATLIDCLNIGATRDHIQFRAAQTVYGPPISDENEPFCGIDIEMEGCGQWFGLRGLRFEQGTGEGMRMNYIQPPKLDWHLNSGMTVTYSVNMGYEAGPQPKEHFNLQETPTLSIRSPEPKTLTALHRIATNALSLVEFCADRTVPITRVYLLKAEDPESWYELGSWQQEGRETLADHPLIRFPAIKDKFGQLLQKWMQIYESMPLALNLYRTCKRSANVHVEFRLFGLISALESLHRTLFPQPAATKCSKCDRRFEMSLKERLEDVANTHAEHLGALLTHQECARVAATRNYLAHQTPDLLARSIPQDQWFFWVRRLAAVFEVCILNALPIGGQLTNNIAKNRLAAIAKGALGEWNI